MGLIQQMSVAASFNLIGTSDTFFLSWQSMEIDMRSEQNKLILALNW